MSRMHDPVPRPIPDHIMDAHLDRARQRRYMAMETVSGHPVTRSKEGPYYGPWYGPLEAHFELRDLPLETVLSVVSPQYPVKKEYDTYISDDEDLEDDDDDDVDNDVDVHLGGKTQAEHNVQAAPRATPVDVSDDELDVISLPISPITPPVARPPFQRSAGPSPNQPEDVQPLLPLSGRPRSPQTPQRPNKARRVERDETANDAIRKALDTKKLRRLRLRSKRIPDFEVTLHLIQKGEDGKYYFVDDGITILLVEIKPPSSSPTEAGPNQTISMATPQTDQQAAHLFKTSRAPKVLGIMIAAGFDWSYSEIVPEHDPSPPPMYSEIVDPDYTLEENSDSDSGGSGSIEDLAGVAIGVVGEAPEVAEDDEGDEDNDGNEQDDSGDDSVTDAEESEAEDDDDDSAISLKAFLKKHFGNKFTLPLTDVRSEAVLDAIAQRLYRLNASLFEERARSFSGKCLL